MIRFKEEFIPGISETSQEKVFIMLEDSMGDTSDPFRIIISSHGGIKFKGESPYIMPDYGLDEFALAVTRAIEKHMDLQPNLNTNERGH